MKKTVKLYGLSCESCNSLIERYAEKSGVKVESGDFKAGQYVFEAASSAEIDSLLSNLEKMGYTQTPKQSGRLTRATATIGKLLFTNEFSQERTMLLTAAGALFASIILQVILGSFFAKRAEASVLFPFALFLDIGVAASLFAAWHVSKIREKTSCMTGMMVGMTSGMMAGLMVGYALGASNGMFVGSVVGMAIGFVLGTWAGSGCGVMGAMEGMMAGVMAGTMGAMLAVMMLADNLLAFMAIFLVACLSILAAHTYMIMKEFGPAPAGGQWKTAVAIIVANVVLYLLMLIGPKSAIAIA